MLSALQRHPFPVVAHFDRVVAVSFAFPVEVLGPLVPAPLEIDTYGDLGFVTVALVWTRQMRPAGLPRFLGSDFFLAGYRVFARLRDETGRRLRGLRILRSETDRARMVWAGNFFTHYHYRQVRVTAEATRVVTTGGDGRQTLDLEFEADSPAPSLPPGSPFPDWHAARLFAGPMPFTFSPLGDGRCLVIEGRRQSWAPRPIAVTRWEATLFAEPPLAGSEPLLANAFAVENIDYRWERGRIVAPGGAP